MDVANEAAFAPTSSGPSTPRPGTPSVPPPLQAADVDRASSSTARPASQEDGKVDNGADGGGSDAASSAEKDEATSAQPKTASLEQEVGQVVSQLSTWGTSLWGGLRKQSTVAFETVKKDMSRTVAEVQDEFQKLQNQKVEVEVKDKPLGEDKVDKGKGKAEGEGAGAPPVAGSGSVKSGLQSLTSSTSAQDFLSKLQTTIQSATQSSNIHLPENLSKLHLSENLASFQKSVTDTISSAAHNPNLDVTQIRSSLVQNIQKNLQGVNLKQAEKLAEEYLKKSEGLLAEAGEFLKDAVKVVPPEEGDGSGIGMAWDGSDMYSFSTSTANNLPADEVIFDQSSSFLGGTRGASSEVIRAQRKDALMRRLRSDKELLLVDPAAEAESLARRESFKAFVEHEIEGRGGVEGDEITKMIWQELGPEAKDAEVLKATRDALVPSQLAHELFWTRYFFHKHQIELEEEKRKKLLAATQQPHKEEEDFSWDDNEEETTPKMAASEQSAAPTAKLHPSSAQTASVNATPTLGSNSSGTFEAADNKPSAASALAARAIGSSASTSPRESEESYDIVSDQAEVIGSKVSAPAPPAPKGDEGSDSDSDWE